MTDVVIQIDDTTKREAEAIFSQLGMSIPVAVKTFLARTITEGGLPFKVEPKTDEKSPYNPEFVAMIRQAEEDERNGKFIAKTMDELRAMEDEDSPYSPELIALIRQGEEDKRTGNVVIKTWEELEAMANE